MTSISAIQLRTLYASNTSAFISKAQTDGGVSQKIVSQGEDAMISYLEKQGNTSIFDSLLKQTESKTSPPKPQEKQSAQNAQQSGNDKLGSQLNYLS